MKRCFIFKDAKSQKFWNIEQDGCAFTVNYGKLGTAGQTTQKSFDSEEKCEKEANKLVTEKMKKGYVESTEDDVKSQKNEAKKYSLSYEEGEDDGPQKIIDKILKDKRLPDLKFITIGYWGECFEQAPQKIIDAIIENKDKFAHIESLFIGDMDYEECEMSWIIQGDYSKIFAALPNLQEMKIQGSSELVLGKGLVHENLKSFGIICGGLPKTVLDDLIEAKFPSLEKLIVYLGVDDYGLDCKPEDFAPLLKKDKFPNLKHLGLVNSEEQNEYAELILNSEILPQLETIDLSCGCLTDEGGQKILDAKDKLGNLKKLNMNYHYMSKDMMKELKKLPFDVDVSDQQEDDDYMCPMITE